MIWEIYYEKLARVLCLKPSNFRTLLLIIPTTQQGDQRWEVKVLKKDLTTVLLRTTLTRTIKLRYYELSK